MNETIFYLKVITSMIILSVFVFIFIKSKDRWIIEVYKKVFTDNPGMSSSELFPVNHSPKPPGIFSFLTEKTTGIIAIKDNSVSFLGYKTENQPVKLHFPVNNLETAWLGKLNSLSRTHWFLFKNGDEKHYFCAETGELFSKSESLSKETFEKITKQLGKIVHN